MKSFYKSKSKLDLSINKSFKLNNNNNIKYLSGKINEINDYENHISENKKENDIINVSDNDEDISFPKLEEYNIENDEEEKIDKIRNISNIKTYGERKKFYQNYNSAYTLKNNNFFISIKESSNKKEKMVFDSFKNGYQSENIDYNKIIKESNTSLSNKYDSQEDSYND